MSYRLVVLQRARADIRRHRDWLISRDAEDAASRAVEAIEAATKQVVARPERRPLRQDGARHWLVSFGRHGYVIRYLIRGDDVVIQRIWHGREDRPV